MRSIIFSVVRGRGVHDLVFSITALDGKREDNIFLPSHFVLHARLYVRTTHMYCYSREIGVLAWDTCQFDPGKE